MDILILFYCVFAFFLGINWICEMIYNVSEWFNKVNRK